MMPLNASPARGANRRVRPATPSDQQKIADLIFFESHVHRHLDWRTPLDWLGFSPYWVFDEGRQITGALACPTDPDSIAWIRLFAFASHLSWQEVWPPLWNAARKQLAEQSGATAAAIATQHWFEQMLAENRFERTGRIVMLQWDAGAGEPSLAQPVLKIRAMTTRDLANVTAIDAAAFEPLWRNSLAALTKAYQQSSYATVAEDESGIIGYQLSTGGSFGAHLARLAVAPEAQGRGIGSALVADLILHMRKGGGVKVTVNTQDSNAASLSLYSRLGFLRTGEEYPVYTLPIT
jgi:ribosomal-protein-alanine N-acetyltransferase